MTRWLTGVFDPSGRADSSRLSAALAPHGATLHETARLKVAYSGAPTRARAPLCLLDGYLDNAPDLRAALGVGVEASDEELLASAWVRWGAELPSRLRGDFALLVWDEERGKGILARDQLGVRPMFLHGDSGALCFAGEVRHLLALLPVRPAPDPASLAHWITMSNRPGSSTLYEGIRRLNPGAALMLDARGGREITYWAPRFAEPLGDTEPQLAERVRASLGSAVARRIAPNGLTGVLMSGGLDSTAIAAVAAEQAPGRVTAQSAVFPEHPDVDESGLIAEVREALALGGLTAEVRAGGLVASALSASAEWQVPLRSWGDFWALPLLRAASAAGVRVTLGGDGGDELFGVRGYLSADRLRAGHPLQALRLIRALPGAGERPPRREVARIFGETAVMGLLGHRLHTLLQRSSARRHAPSWLREPAARGLLDSDDALAWKRLAGPRWWAEVAHGLTRGVEETGVFEHQRRRAASAGLDARHPLFDLELVELCLRLPPQSTFDPHRSRPVLRTAMAGMLPDSVRLRPGKALFDSLLLDSLAGADGAFARALLTDPRAELGAYVDLRGLDSALFGSAGAPAELSFRWMWQIWRLLTAECWLRLQAGRSVPTGAPPPSEARVLVRAPSNPGVCRG